MGRGGSPPDLGRSGAPEDHDQRGRLVRAAPAQPTPALSRLAPPLRAYGAGHAGAALARPAVPRPARAARLPPRPPRRTAQRGARRARRAAERRGAGTGALPPRARQPPAELRSRRGARAPALPRGRGARRPHRRRGRRPPLPQSLTTNRLSSREPARRERRASLLVDIDGCTVASLASSRWPLIPSVIGIGPATSTTS